MRLIVPALAVALLLSGCSEPTIDATSKELLKQTSEEVRSSLPESKRSDFDKAMQVLALSKLDLGALFAEGAAGAGNLESRIRDELHGKTGPEILAAWKRLEAERQKEREERERRKHEEGLAEIRELEDKKAQAENAKAQLKRFAVLSSELIMEERKYGRDQPIIKMTIRNGTPYPVARGYFRGVVSSPGRAVPWLEETFSYEIPGGVQPTEEKTWRLAPNSYSDWGRVEVPADAVLKVSVEQLDGADGEPIYSARAFSERDERRLANLRDELKD